jgi:hypothetical protein
MLSLLMLALVMCWSVAVMAQELPQEPVVTHMPDVFERLWSVYPNKTDRQGAVQAWNDLRLTEEELNKMRLEYPRWRFSSEWTRSRGKHVPPLSKWLGERMWERDPPPPAPPTLAELSSFLIQPLYLAPRLAYAAPIWLAGILAYPWDPDAGDRMLKAGAEPPWVWHEFLMRDDE